MGLETAIYKNTTSIKSDTTSILAGLLPTSTPAVVDVLDQASAAANHTTLYTVATYSGEGVLCAVGELNATSVSACYLSITIDSTEEIYDATLTSGIFWNGTGSNSLIIPFGGIKFNTSLLVKIANDDGSTANIQGACVYGTSSVEYYRQIIPAGEIIPAGTNYQKLYGVSYRIDEIYDTDVMVITYLTQHGKSAGNLSTRVIFPREDRVKISIDPITGKVSGKLQKTVFNMSPHMPFWKYEDSNEDCEQIIEVNDTKYRINVLNGIAQTQKIPPVSVNAKSIQDAR